MRLDTLKPIGLALWLLCLSYTSIAENPTIKLSHFPSGEPLYYSISSCLACDNITNGGTIGADEIGCPNPVFDPHLIYNITLPTGGTGTIEYQWMYTYENPNYPSATWSPIPNANGESYDPGPLTQTTYFMRCSRRSGCVLYSGETNFVKKIVQCCPGNIEDGGIIAADQKSCTIPYDPDVLISVKGPTGGTGNILYQWLSSPIGGSTNNGTWNVISGAVDSFYNPPLLTKTMYFVRRARQEFCPEFEYSNVLKILITNGVLITTSKVDPTCFEGDNGSATVTVTQGVSPVTYIWSNSVIMTPTLLNLGGGMYKVTVTDAAGCSVNATITLNEPGEINVVATIQPIPCTGQLTGKITLNVSGGLPAYTFKWSSGETTQNLVNKAGGTYTVTVTDSKQCTQVKSFTILEGTIFTVTPTIINNKCFGDLTGSVKISVTGGSLPYTYLWSNGGNTNEITNLATGTYTVTITDKDACSKVSSFDVIEVSNIVITSKAFSPKCNLGHDGSILIVASGGKTPYTYKWSIPGLKMPVASGLTAGIYTITVTDANSCSNTKTFNIQEPEDISISASIIKPDCAIGNNGSIDITTSGGTAPYTFMWNGNISTEDQFNISEGSYTLIVSDTNGCVKQEVFDVGIENDITISETILEPYCQTSNGSITLNISGGQGPYNYIWSNNATTKDLSNLSAGVYTVTITDNKSCSKIRSFNLSDNGSVDITGNTTSLKCFADSIGSITINITGGFPPYVVEWSNGIKDSVKLHNLTAGIYSVTVTDKNQCKSVNSFVIDSPLELSINPIVVNPLCGDSLTGSINLIITGGTFPYNYLWSNASQAPNLNGLGAGKYMLTVTDANSCTNVKEVIITEPMPLVLNAAVIQPSCPGLSTGSISLQVSGGSGPFTFFWNGVNSSQVQNNLPEGEFGIKVVDVNACHDSITVNLEDPKPIEIQGTVTDPYCSLSNGIISLNVTGGSEIYAYKWSNGSTNKDQLKLAPGSYKVTITDSNLCTGIDSFKLTDKGELKLSGLIEDVKCNGDTTGTIEIIVSGGVLPYTYQWSTGTPAANKIGGLKAGIYTVTVSDANQCTAYKVLEISEAPSIDINGLITDPKCFEDNNGSINISISGGTPAYSFKWSNGVLTQNNANLSSGNYILTVTDLNGCSEVSGYLLKEPDPIVSSETITQLNCNSGASGKIELTVSGGLAPYTYQWSNGSTTKDIDSLSTDIYIVTITDANFCTANRTVILTEPTEIILQGIVINTTCNGGANGIIDLSITGGIAPYTYHWSNGSTTKNLINLTAGNYIVTVVDAAQCSRIQTFSVSEGNNLFVQDSITQLKCNGNSNASIALNVSGGIPPYIFTWSTGSQTNSITSLTSGTYGVTITDQTGCKQVRAYTITEPDPINVLVLKQNITCIGNADGKLQVMVSGGQMPFSLVWSTGITGDTIGNLTAGSYTLTVTDSQGCSKLVNTVLSDPLKLKITANITTPSCLNTIDGKIDVTISGGTQPYTYLWLNNATTQDLSGLAPGNYTLAVTDKNGCTQMASFNVGVPVPINFDLQINDQSCINQNNGSASVINLTGGTAPYSYKWNNFNNSTTQTVSNLAPGFYLITVTDSKGCALVKNFEVKSSNVSCTLKIGDYLWTDANKNGIQDINESGVNGIVVHLINVGPDTIPGTGDDILTDTETTKTVNGKKGCYYFTDVPAGLYVIKFFIDNNSFKFTTKDAGKNEALDSDINPGSAYTDKFVVKKGDGDNLNYDAGIYEYCKNVTYGGLICCDEILCTIGQTPTLIMNVQLPTGGTGPIEYLWLYSTKNPVYFPGSPDWIMIPNSNTPSYQPGPLYETTYFIRCAKTGDCSNFAGETNVVNKTVVDGKIAEIFGAPSTICKNKIVKLSSVNYGPGVTYLWDLGAGAIPAVATTNNVDVIWTFAGVKTIKLSVSYNNCTSTDVGVIVISNCFSTSQFGGFNAVMNEDLQVDLEWKVEDHDHHVFEIERSEDGKHFTVLQGFEGMPDHNGLYRFKDISPAVGDNFYRIRMIEKDAASSYTEVKKVNLEDFYKRSIAVYPNPAINNITIEPIKLTSEKSILEISDELGIIKYMKELEPEFKQFNIDISKYISGTYFVKIKETGKRVITYKIFKID